MRCFWILISLSVAFYEGFCSQLESELPLERDEIIDAVNNANTTWRAGRNFHPSIKRSYVKFLLGLKRDTKESRLPPLEDDGEDVEIPESFDSREKWSHCVSIRDIRDQGNCGSCWAVSAASVFSDRLCIASNGKFNSFLSAQELLTCCTECGSGCEGGHDDDAWNYFISNGIVTGGDYNSKLGCQPYTLEPCEHVDHPGPRKNCSALGPVYTPQCKQECYNKEYKEPTFIKDHHKVKKAFSISGDVVKIQKEIMTNGPVQAGFQVFEDFFSYTGGVYRHVTGTFHGLHAIKILGWGVDHGTPYWLVANSWNTDWGLDGLFKIKRGNDECGIEDTITGGTPIVH